MLRPKRKEKIVPLFVFVSIISICMAQCQSLFCVVTTNLELGMHQSIWTVKCLQSFIFFTISNCLFDPSFACMEGMSELCLKSLCGASFEYWTFFSSAGEWSLRITRQSNFFPGKTETNWNFTIGGSCKFYFTHFMAS